MLPLNGVGSQRCGTFAEMDGAELEARLQRANQGLLRGCLVCRRSDGGFTSREHPFPESIGNTEIVLENGVVCDRCNNGVLSRLDQTLCEFMPINFRRTMLGIRSKEGRVPTSRFTDGVVEHVGPAALRFESHDNREMLREVEHLEDGRVRLEFNLKGGRRMTPRYASDLSRALLKTALELAWLDHGQRMLEAQFDHVREAILGRKRSGFIAMAKRGAPDHVQATMTYDLVPHDGCVRITVVAVYFGVGIATDSMLAEPAANSALDELQVHTFKPDDFPGRTKSEAS